MIFLQKLCTVLPEICNTLKGIGLERSDIIFLLSNKSNRKFFDLSFKPRRICLDRTIICFSVLSVILCFEQLLIESGKAFKNYGLLTVSL